MLPDNGSFDQTDHEDSDKTTFALKSPIITQESSDSSEKSSSQDRRQSEQKMPSLPLTEIQSLSLSSNQKKNLQAALLNFIATCPIASDGIINVSHDQFEFYCKNSPKRLFMIMKTVPSLRRSTLKLVFSI